MSTASRKRTIEQSSLTQQQIQAGQPALKHRTKLSTSTATYQCNSNKNNIQLKKSSNKQTENRIRSNQKQHDQNHNNQNHQNQNHQNQNHQRTKKVVTNNTNYKTTESQNINNNRFTKHQNQTQNHNRKQTNHFQTASKLRDNVNQNQNQNDHDSYLFKEINPWLPKNIKIVARVMHKTNVRTRNCFGKQKDLFTVILIDSESDLMQMQFWADLALKYASMLREGELYSFENMQIRTIENEKYALYSKFELVCTPRTSIVKLESTKKHILKESWDLIESVEDLEKSSEDDVIDIIGVVCNVGTVEEKHTKWGKTVTKLDFELADSTARVRCTAWGEQSQALLIDYTIIGLKKAKVSKYGGRSLNVNGFIKLNPSHSQVDDIKEWIEDSNQKVEDLVSNVRSLTDVTNVDLKHDFTNAQDFKIAQLLFMSEKFRETQNFPDTTVFKLTAKIKNIAQNMFYEKNGKHLWCLRLSLVDEDKKWIKAVAFEKPAKSLFQKDGDAAKKMQTNQPIQFGNMIQAMIEKQQQYVFYMYCKENNYFSNARLDFIIERIQVKASWND